MRGQRPVHAQVGAASNAMTGQKGSGEFLGAMCIGTCHVERVGLRGRHQQTGCGGRRTDAAEPSPARTAQIEDTEMQAGERFNADGPSGRCELRGSQERLLTSLPPMTAAEATSFKRPLRGVLALSTYSNSPCEKERPTHQHPRIIAKPYACARR